MGGLNLSRLNLGFHRRASGSGADAATIFAEGDGGYLYEAANSTIYTDTGGTTEANADDAVARIDDRSGNGNNATQATGANQFTLREADGVRYFECDGANTYMMTGFTPGSVMTLAAKVRRVAGAMSQFEVIMGSRGSISQSFAYIGVEDDTSAGRLGASVGQTGIATINGGPDVRGEDAIVEFYFSGPDDADEYELKVNGTVVKTGAVGTPFDVGAEFAIGARNTNGTIQVHFEGRAYNFFTINRRLTSAESERLRSAWGN